jgi:hypothetical protein
LLGNVKYEDGSGLANQVIINAGNLTPAGSWSGSVAVDGTTLATTPYYSQASSGLGGGAVGLAPFHLYDSDCVPANGATVSAIPDNVIRLRFYGPITYNTSYTPVKVEYYPYVQGQAPDDDGPWVDITSDFTFSATTNPRELLVIPGTYLDFANGTWYRITRAGTSGLRCTGVTGTPSVGSFTYIMLRH